MQIADERPFPATSGGRGAIVAAHRGWFRRRTPAQAEGFYSSPRGARQGRFPGAAASDGCVLGGAGAETARAISRMKLVGNPFPMLL